MLPAEIPQELIDILDKAAGRQHSRSGSVVTCLAEILTRYDEMRCNVKDPVHGADAERWGGWSWSDPRDGEHFRTCSYCGGMNPYDLAAELHSLADGSLYWADWKYGWPHKVYVNIPNREPGKLFVVGTSYSDSPIAFRSDQWRPVADLTDAECEIINESHRDLTQVTHILFGERPYFHAKFYSVHLLDVGLKPTVKIAIEKASGIHFEMLDDGTIRWQKLSSMN